MKLDEVKDLGYAVVIALPTDAELSKDSAAILAASPPINVLRMFAGTGDMFPALLAMVKAVFYDREIEPRLREVIVLRCAHLLDCPYEWQANMVMAPNAGVTAQEIAVRRQSIAGPPSTLARKPSMIPVSGLRFSSQRHCCGMNVTG